MNAMRETGMAAMGRFVQQGREKLCLIRPKGDALALETLFLSADVYSQAEIEEAVEETTVKKPELALAQQVIESLSGDFDPSELQSDYRRDLKALLEAKLAGEEITAPEEPAEDAPVIDLMEALRRSVEDAKQAKQPAGAKKAAPKKAACAAQVRRALETHGSERWPRSGPLGLERSGSASADSMLVRLGHGSQRLELRLEERLVDLALVDRHAFLDADPDHFLPVDAQLLRELVRRQVICHSSSSLCCRSANESRQ